MLRSGKARRMGFAADPPEQLVTKRSSCLPGAGLAVRSTMPPFAKPCRSWRALIGPCPNRPHRHASRKSPLGKCDRQAFDCTRPSRPRRALKLVGSRLLEQILTRTVLFLVPSRRSKRLNHNLQWRVGNFGENYDAQSQNSRAFQIRERDDGN